MDCCAVVEGMVFVKDVDRLVGSDKVHNATVVRSHERRRWRLSGPEACRVVASCDLRVADPGE
jgi:hypothetical protein